MRHLGRLWLCAWQLQPAGFSTGPPSPMPLRCELTPAGCLLSRLLPAAQPPASAAGQPAAGSRDLHTIPAATAPAAAVLIAVCVPAANPLDTADAVPALEGPTTPRAYSAQRIPCSPLLATADRALPHWACCPVPAVTDSCWPADVPGWLQAFLRAPERAHRAAGRAAPSVTRHVLPQGFYARPKALCRPFAAGSATPRNLQPVDFLP